MQGSSAQQVYRILGSQAYFRSVNAQMLCPAEDAKGPVLWDLHVGQDGKMLSEDLLRGDAALANATQPQIAKWSWKPIVVNGSPVAWVSTIGFDFGVKDGKCQATPVFYFDDPEDEVAAAKRKAVSAGDAQKNIVKQTSPAFPPAGKVKKGHELPPVVLAGTINKDGKVLRLSAVGGDPHLIEPAIEAVRQWEYRPFVVDGVPTEVDTTFVLDTNAKK